MKIDHQVIDGHVIPNQVLFTAPTPSNKPYETLAFGDNLKVTISFSTEHSDKGSDKCKHQCSMIILFSQLVAVTIFHPPKILISTDYVKSDTLVGDSSHPSASVLAEIVKPNIPVKNGVVHLIQNPLMVVDTTVQEFIQVSSSYLPLYLFSFTSSDIFYRRSSTEKRLKRRKILMEACSLTDHVDLLLKRLLEQSSEKNLVLLMTLRISLVVLS